MGRVERKKRDRKKIIIAVEILCLIALVFGVYKAINIHRINKEAAKKAETEAETGAGTKAEGEFLVLVNNDREIPEGYLDEITTVEVENGYEVDERIADDLNRMLADCREAGYSPQIISAFRTREDQEYLYDHTANKSDTAVPGHSEHECGLAVDIIDAESAGWDDPLIDEQEDTPAQKWLMENCHRYGFILRYPKDKEDITEIIYEPWHYRYVGADNAEKIMKEGICLEEYVDPDTYKEKNNE